MFLAMLLLAACSEGRKDPCRLLSVEDVQTVDETVAVAIWAGRDGDRKDDEVCVFHNADGDARLMLFVWYDRESDPEALVTEGVGAQQSNIAELPGFGSSAVASFKDNELKLLAVKSSLGVVGIRVRKPVARNSDELNELARLAEMVLSKNH